ncbi:DMT family transporter [uncultured Tateyamaria sp.]|uniref:DMT family transporter n=1 Tax=uncultured Tateyamaria sp. TaxID=455651 RepID=UPI0026344D10|nr:DMT family transporter [uncultured Tateyamaria sp.]
MAALTISIQDVVFKLFSSNLTLWQIFALRGVLAVPLLLTVSWMRGAHKGILRAAFGKWPLLRALFITTTFLAFYAAIPFISLSTVGAANYIAPIFVALLSAYVIKEAVGPLGWIGVLLGFVGVVVLLQPGTDAFSPWVLLPVMGAAFYALAHITTRTRCQGVPLAALSLSQNTVMLLAGISVSLLLVCLKPQGEMVAAYPYIFGEWSTVRPNDWLVLLLLAGFAVVIGMMLAGAYQAAPPSTVATFEYSYLVFVAVWDILFFDIAPTVASITGVILVVTAGLLVLRRSSHTANRPVA